MRYFIIILCLLNIFSVYSQNTPEQRSKKEEYIRNWLQKSKYYDINFDTTALRSVAASEIYSQIEIFYEEGNIEKSFELLQKLGVDPEHFHVENNEQGSNRFSIILHVSSSQRKKIDSSGLKYRVIIENETENFKKKNASAASEKTEFSFDKCLPPTKYDVPINFKLGSMGGHFTYIEILEHLDNMHAKYPSIISKRFVLDSTIKTHYGNFIYAVKIGNSPEIPEDEPEILYTGVHHAREPLSVSSLIYFMYYLLENYENDQSIKKIVDELQIYFIPVINPDGYIFNELNNPEGGGMWRKNMYGFGAKILGVDLNRNYAFNWGIDDIGSSPDPADETYRGTEPFSEPETKVVRDFCKKHRFSICLNYHSYGNNLLNPEEKWLKNSDDSTAYKILSELLTQSNRYSVGSFDQQLRYTSNGDATDWMYADTEEKNNIITFVSEVGNPFEGFWPLSGRIVPFCAENLDANIKAAQSLLNYVELDNCFPLLLDSKSNSFSDTIQAMNIHISLGNSKHEYIFQPITQNIQFITKSILFPEKQPPFQVKNFPFQITLSPGTKNGDLVAFTAKSKLSPRIYRTYNHYYGKIDTIFSENFSTLSLNKKKWSFGNAWKINEDSGGNRFLNCEAENWTEMNLRQLDSIDLKGAMAAELSFYSKWKMNRGYGYYQVLISSDGRNWEPICGSEMTFGSKFQVYGQPIIQDNQKDWIRVSYDLKDYLGKEIKLRFRVNNEISSFPCELLIDNLNVLVIKDLVTREKLRDNKIFSISPNPINEKLCLNYHHYQNNSTLSELQNEFYLEIFNVLGQSQMIYPININDKSGKIILDLSGINKGIYQCVIRNRKNVFFSEKLIIE